jgi:hypothetical protein
MTDLEKIAKLNYKVSVLRIEKEALLNRNDRLQSKADALQNEVEALKADLKQTKWELDQVTQDLRSDIYSAKLANSQRAFDYHLLPSDLMSGRQNYAGAQLAAQIMAMRGALFP